MGVAALFVETGGCYFGLPGVDPWDEARRQALRGPHPVVAHPPCQRWGRFWHGSTRKPHQFRRGEDGGCFAAALTAVRNYGGVLEHPAGIVGLGLISGSQAPGWPGLDHGRCLWRLDLPGRSEALRPQRAEADMALRLRERPQPATALDWSKSDRTPPQWMVERYGEAKARKIGQVAMVGGKDKTRIRNATPPEFRDRAAVDRALRSPGRRGMTPKLEALRDALQRLDKIAGYGREREEAHAAVVAAARAAGFSQHRAAEDWARYQVAVGESAEQLVEVEEPEPDSMELFG
jgi:hypothetical protein